MPGLRDNETVQIRINSWGSIIQEESKFDGGSHYYKVKSASGEKSETIWGDHFFLRAVVQGWPGADGVMAITRINKERYEAKVVEQGQPGDPQMMEFSNGQMQQVPMPDTGADAPPPAPKAPVAAPAAPVDSPYVKPPSPPTNGRAKPEAADVVALMRWAMSMSYERWDELCKATLGDDYTRDETFWINVRTTADAMFIHCTRTGIRAPGNDEEVDAEAGQEPEAAAKEAAAKMIAGVMDGEIIEAPQATQDDLPF